MNKSTLLATIFLLLAFSAELFSQQSSISGIVTIQNSKTETGKKIFVNKARVEDDLDRANPQVTDNNGRFTLTFVGINEKHKVSFNVIKDNLEVVNIDQLSAITGQANNIYISMAPKSKIADYRKSLYKIGKTSAETRLHALLSQKAVQLEKLKKNNLEKSEEIIRLMKEIGVLQEQLKKVNEQAEELAIRYSKIDLDYVSPTFREAFTLFKRGHLDSALLLINKVSTTSLLLTKKSMEKSIAIHSNQLLQEQKDLEAFTEQTTQLIEFKIDLLTRRYDFDSVIANYNVLFQLDSTNLLTILNYGKFLLDIGEYQNALKIYSYAPSIVAIDSAFKDQNQISLLGDIYINVGICLKNIGNFPEAEVYYRKARSIFEQLSYLNSEKYALPYTKVMVNIGNFYALHRMFAEAERHFVNALEIRQELFKEKPEKYIADLAVVKMNLGALYAEFGPIDKGEKYCLTSISLYRQLQKKLPGTYIPEYASACINLGLVYFKKKEYEKALSYYKIGEANYIAYRTIYKNSHTVQLNIVFMNIAKTLLLLGNYESAKLYFQMAYQGFEKLNKYYPNLYKEYVKEIQIDLEKLNHTKAKK